MSEIPDIVFVMGVSGCGKSTIGEALARKLGWGFMDGDSFHSPENVEKMRTGVALTDSDRFPWLREINSFARTHPRHVIACSSLKKTYRAMLSEHINAKFFLLNIKREILEQRVSSRPGHFMPLGLLDSQLNTLEMPGNDEPHVIVVDASSSGVEDVVSSITTHFQV